MVKTEAFTNNQNDYLIAGQNSFALSCILGNTGVSADSNGRKIIKAGTPLYIGTGKNVYKDRFEVLTENCQAGWHEIAYKGGKAYISSDFVTVAEELQAAPTPTPDPNAMIVVNGSGREEAAEESGAEGLTSEKIEDTEDPARR